MGMAATLRVCKDGNFIDNLKEGEWSIFDGRNREWFDNLMGNGNSSEYEWGRFPAHVGVEDDNIPQEWKDEYSKEMCYFGWHYITVKDFSNWFYKYSPHICGGWISKYDEFMLKYKSIEPEEYYTCPDCISNFDGCVFATWENQYDCSKWLFEWLEDNKMPNDAVIVYRFDN